MLTPALQRVLLTCLLMISADLAVGWTCLLPPQHPTPASKDWASIKSLAEGQDKIIQRQ